MSALEILRSAYTTGVAPSHLRGRTQHKTLQARLSEDILTQREASRFFRTAPGRFLLRDLMDDQSIPKEFRTPIIARRRQRSLHKERALAFTQKAISRVVDTDKGLASPRSIYSLIQHGDYHYIKNSRPTKDVLVWSFVMVVRGSKILTYRQGAYREGRDPFLLRRTIGFYSPVVDTDRNLFDQGDHGIVSSGLRALAADLDLAMQDFGEILNENAELKSFMLSDEAQSHALLALVTFRCPDWLEPTTKRLAINDLEWMDLRAVNHHEDFDPWSQAVLSEDGRTVFQSLP